LHKTFRSSFGKFGEKSFALPNLDNEVKIADLTLIRLTPFA